MSKKLVDLIENIPGSARRYCHLQLKTFHPNSNENFYLEDFMNIEKGNKIKLKSNSTRLYEKLLDILFQYYETNVDVFYNETRTLQRAMVLNKLGLQSAASKMTDNVIHQATQNHNYLKSFAAFDQRLSFAFEQEDIDYLYKYVSDDRAKKEKMVNDYLNLTDYQALWALVKQESMRDHFFNQEQNFKSTYYNELLNKDEKLLSDEAKIIRYKIQGFLSMKEKKYKEAEMYMFKTKQIYESNVRLAEKDPLEYAKSIKNMCIILTHLKEYDKIQDVLKEYEEKMNFNESKVDQVHLEIRCILMGIQTDVIIYSRNFIFDEQKFNKWEKLILENEEHIPLDMKMSVMYSFFIISMHKRNFRKCKRIFNLILSISDNIRKDIRELALIGELTLHFIEGNIDLLENRLRTFENKIKNEVCFFSFTPDILSFYRMELKSPGDEKNIPILKNILKKAQGGDLGVYYSFNPLLELDMK